MTPLTGLAALAPLQGCDPRLTVTSKLENSKGETIETKRQAKLLQISFGQLGNNLECHRLRRPVRIGRDQCRRATERYLACCLFLWVRSTLVMFRLGHERCAGNAEGDEFCLGVQDE
jgi:hypothetical protein